jgi:UDP-glucuronate decarboxylase
MARILVTGGAGLIGSHLCERLVAQGHHVLCADNLSTGSRANLAALAGDTRFELIVHDLIQPLFVEADQVYHLACPASPVHYRANPVRTIKTNVLGTMHMLGLARRTGARILLARTSEVYGDPQEHPQSENYHGNVNPLGTRACYDEGKRVAETLMMDYHREHAVDIRIARIFNTYGPRMALDDGRVISSFLLKGLREEPMQLHGGGTQTRSFCYVDDLVDGLTSLMAYEGALRYAPINLGNPEEVTVRHLARMCAHALDVPLSTVDVPAEQDDPARRCPDIRRAQSELGWRPRVDLPLGLARTAQDLRARFKERP